MVNNNSNDNIEGKRQSDMMQLLTTADQCQTCFVPTLDAPSFCVTPPNLYTGRDVLGCGVSLWSVWVTCLSCAPFQFLLHTPSMAQHETGKQSP